MTYVRRPDAYASPPVSLVKCRSCNTQFFNAIYKRDILDNHRWTVCPECYYTKTTANLHEVGA
jgi:hypothetical protein